MHCCGSGWCSASAVWSGDAVLEVADEGPGLGPAQTARIFERFYRADTSRTRTTGGGAGLGLAVVDSLGTAHAGHVEIDSAPGWGATFRVRLPGHAELPPTTRELEPGLAARRV
ncbi:ATP-binding region ATPase domain protein [Actinobacteria bacterium OK074]|nr:ATP-binding region ATPase domain protein [Actinobacteria bacterium OK074]